MRTALVGAKEKVIYDYYSGRRSLFDQASDPLDQVDLLLPGATPARDHAAHHEAVDRYRAQRACRSRVKVLPPTP